MTFQITEGTHFDFNPLYESSADSWDEYIPDSISESEGSDCSTDARRKYQLIASKRRKLMSAGDDRAEAALSVQGLFVCFFKLLF